MPEQPLIIFITTADEGESTTIYAESTSMLRSAHRGHRRSDVLGRHLRRQRKRMTTAEATWKSEPSR